MMQWLKELLQTNATAGTPAPVRITASSMAMADTPIPVRPEAAHPVRAEAAHPLRAEAALSVRHEPVEGLAVAPAKRSTSARAAQGETLAKQLALVIDLNVCVGCHACVTSCKQWNTSGSAGPLADQAPYGANPTGTFFNRVQTYEAGSFPGTDTIHFPKSCLHCEDPPCVPVCPTGAATNARKTALCWGTTTNA